MNNIVIRIILIVLAGIGVYKIFPQISTPVDYYLKHPAFQTGVIRPAVLTANKILPEKLKIPTPSEVMGVATEGSASSPLKALTDEVTRQAADLAGEQINQLRKSASEAFCTTLIEKIKAECGLPQEP
jgi:hypothetical protein